MNNPVHYVDPSGHFRDCVAKAYREYRKQGLTPKEAHERAILDSIANGDIKPQDMRKQDMNR